MFRKMRRAEKKAIPNEETIRLLQESKRGVLAVAGDDDYPYAVTTMMQPPGRSIFTRRWRDIK